MVITDNRLQLLAVINSEETILDMREAQELWQRECSVFGNSPESGNCLYLGFDAPFPSATSIHTKWELIEDGNIKRNPITKADELYPLVELAWEYYGLENGQVGWHPLAIKEDTTLNLLFGGYIAFALPGEHQQLEGEQWASGYLIRCRLERGEYDIPPRVRQIFINCLPVHQRQTLCQSWQYSLEDIQEQTITIDSWLGYYGLVKVYNKNGIGWSECQEGIDYIIEYDRINKLGRILLLIDIPVGSEEPLIKVVVWENHQWQKRLTFSSTGWIHQKLATECKHIIDDSLQLMVNETRNDETVVWEDWQSTNDLQQAMADQKCFQSDSTEGNICFGDNRKGRVPEAGQDNIVITDCAITKAARGNIVSSKIDSVLGAEGDFADIQVYQMNPANGGMEKETIEQLEIRMVQDMNTEYRAITAEDYQRIVKATPGLLIKAVKVLPLYRPGLSDYPIQKADNSVTIVVEPYSQNQRLPLSDTYKQNIINHIDKYRLITSKVYVMSPVYVGIEIYGEVIIKTNSYNIESEILNVIEKYIHEIEQRDHDQIRLNYAELYGLIDLLEGITSIRYLRIEPTGYQVNKSKAGDIIIPAYCQFNIVKQEITYIQGNLK
jgi:hypothetical protein